MYFLLTNQPVNFKVQEHLVPVTGVSLQYAPFYFLLDFIHI